MNKKYCLYNCSGQSTISSIGILLIVAVLTFLPFNLALSEASDSHINIEESEKLNLRTENLNFGIEALIDDFLYINLEENTIINFIKIGIIDCNISGIYSKMNNFNVSNCLYSNIKVSPIIIVDTNKGIFKSEAYIENNLFGEFDTEMVEK